MLCSVKGLGIDPSTWAKDFDSKTPNSGDGKDMCTYGNPELDKLIDKVEAISETRH